jgi:hypothetical protein
MRHGYAETSHEKASQDNNYKKDNAFGGTKMAEIYRVVILVSVR